MIKRKLNGKTIAILGASSNIGASFILKAASLGANIIAFARDINKIPKFPRDSARVMIVQGDITKLKDVAKALRTTHIETTVNFAADFSSNLQKAKAVNVEGEKNVLNSSIKYGIKRHIYISTIACLNPKPNTYRDTKLEAENSIKIIGKQLDWIILRFANVLGTPTWDNPFKIIFPFLRFAVPKVPTDARDARFPYVTIETATDAILAAIESRPRQTITVLDGEITIGRYLNYMNKIYKIRVSFLPQAPLKFSDKLFGKIIPQISAMSSAVEFLAHPPRLENLTMKKELRICPKPFESWIRLHFPQLNTY